MFSFFLGLSIRRAFVECGKIGIRLGWLCDVFLRLFFLCRLESSFQRAPLRRGKIRILLRPLGLLSCLLQLSSRRAMLVWGKTVALGRPRSVLPSLLTLHLGVEPITPPKCSENSQSRCNRQPNVI